MPRAFRDAGVDEPQKKMAKPSITFFLLAKSDFTEIAISSMALEFFRGTVRGNDIGGRKIIFLQQPKYRKILPFCCLEKQKGQVI